MDDQSSSNLGKKLSIVRRKHNFRVLASWMYVFPALFLCLLAPQLKKGPRHYLLSAWFVSVICIYRWLWNGDAKLCQEEGLLCPYCQRPLYQGGMNSFSIAGICPHCQKRIMDKPAGKRFGTKFEFD